MKYLILSSLFLIVLNSCGHKVKSNPPPPEGLVEGSDTPNPTDKPNPTVNPTDNPTPDPNKPTPVKNFFIQGCVAKFWSYNFQNYSMIALMPSITDLNLSDVTINDTSFQTSGAFSTQNVMIGNASSTNVFSTIDQNGGNLYGSFGPNFEPAFSHGLVFFAKQHQPMVWNSVNVKFVYAGGSIDISSVCPPLPFLPLDPCNPLYRSVQVTAF
jgi:hypothetical protein